MAADIPDVKDFDDIEALDKAFKKAIAKADESDEVELKVAHAQAQAAFWRQQNDRHSLEVAKLAALAKYPLAGQFADDLTGKTPEEIEAKAKKFHEALAASGAKTPEQLAADQQELANRAAATNAYGSPAAAINGGGNASPSPQLTAREEAISRFQARLARGEGLQKPADKMDVIMGTTERLRQAIDFQSVPHPELGLGIGGSYKGEGPSDRRIVDARVEQRKTRR